MYKKPFWHFQPEQVTNNEQKADNQQVSPSNANAVLSAAFSLGQQITVENVLKRRTKFSTPNEYGISKRLKVWERVPLKKATTAIIVGIRTLSNGNTDYDYEVGYMYNPTEYFKALLVVSSLKNAPYFVECPHGSR